MHVCEILLNDSSWVTLHFVAIKNVSHNQVLGLSFVFFKILEVTRGAWVAQWVGCLTLDFGSGYDLKVMRSSPTLGSTPSVEPS